ncbi:MAG: FtsW/RodA/SpoVE family cell cycle protein, partial [Lachnospiraceae bacterium]|nr:FtsW/RodA/SpoVE family cell cycle protein [Lachnospiraceae bacterium]
RVQAFLDPWSVIETMGYQISQSLFALGYGGVFGAGLTKGASSMIPFVETDFIFAAVAEELGILTAVCVILLYLHTFLVIVKLSLDYVDAFAQRFVFGIALTFIFQTFLTIGGEIKFIPSTGVTLPLVSYGGSSLLATYLMFTLVQVVHMLQEERVRGFEERYRQEKQAELEAAYEAKYRARKKAALEAARQKEERKKREVYEETEYNWDADTGEIDLTEFAEVTYDPDE